MKHLNGVSASGWGISANINEYRVLYYVEIILAILFLLFYIAKTLKNKKKC